MKKVCNAAMILILTLIFMGMAWFGNAYAIAPPIAPVIGDIYSGDGAGSVINAPLFTTTTGDAAIDETVNAILDERKYVLVYFYMEGIDECREWKTLLEERQEFFDNVELLEIDSGEHPTVAEQFGSNGCSEMFLVISRNENGYLYTQMHIPVGEPMATGSAATAIERSIWNGHKALAGEACDPTGLIGDKCEDNLSCKFSPKIGEYIANINLFTCFPQSTDTLYSREECAAMFNGSFAALTYDPYCSGFLCNMTSTLGTATSIAAVSASSTEVGVFFQVNGNYGCYETTCTGYTTDIEIAWGLCAGVINYDYLDGESTVLTAEAGIFPFSLSISTLDSFDDYLNVCLWLDLGLAPMAGSSSTCNTSIIDIGSYNPDTGELSLYNVSPEVHAGAEITVREGDSAKFGGDFFDDDSDSWTVTVDFGDGSPPQPATYYVLSGSYASYGFQSPDHTYQDDGTYTITFYVTDGQGNTGSNVTMVTVNNVAPRLESLEASSPINENNSTILSGTFSDPGLVDTHTVTIQWGDGTSETLNLQVGSRAFTAGHVYHDDDPSGTPSDVYLITVTVSDDDGGVTSGNITVTVNNVNPSIPDLGMTQPNSQFILPVVHTLAFIARAVDQGTDDLTISWDWGDGGSTSTVYSNTMNTPVDITDTKNHAYTAPGTYNVVLTVTDDDGGTAAASIQVTVISLGDALRSTNDFIQSLPGDLFKGKTVNRKNALANMFGALDNMLSAGDYQEMIDHLRNNIREKADGQLGGHPNNDWITGIEAQTAICRSIDDITAYLEQLLTP